MDPFHRSPGRPFDDMKKEQFAKAVARGDNFKVAAQMAGVSHNTGLSWKEEVSMLDRIGELRQGAETFVGVSKAWIVNMLKENAEKAQAANQLKSSTETLGLLYKIISTDKDLGGQGASAMPGDITDEELRREQQKAFGGFLPAPREPELDAIDAVGVEVPA